MRKGKDVIAAFHLPPETPSDVVELRARFDELADRYARRLGEIDDAEQAISAAKAKDHEKAVDAALAGKELPADLNKHEREATAKVDALRATLPPLADAVDQAGNDLLEPIAAARDEWRASLQAIAEEASERYDRAVAEARDALDAMGKAKGAIAWLERFDPAAARVGRDAGWHGKGRVPPIEDPRGREHDAVELLTLAAKATIPTPPRQPRRHKVAA